MEQNGSNEDQTPPEVQKIFTNAWRKVALIDLLAPIVGLFCGAAIGFVVDYLNSTFYLFTILIGVIGLVMGKAAMDRENERQKRFWNSLSDDQRTAHLITKMQKHRKK